MSLVNDGDEKRKLARINAEKRSKARTTAKRQQAAESLSSATEELASGVNEANAASEQLSQAMEIITSGATQSSSAAQQSMAASIQLEKNATLAANLTIQSIEKIESIQTNVRGASSDVDNLISAIEVASNKNIESAKIVEQLSVQAKEVEEVVNAVVEIADQTNLLALNAAVEAARAGEHGRRFAVVAADIRSLATDSATNAEKIKSMVKDIKEKAAQVAKDVLESGLLAELEVKNSVKTTAALNGIEKDMTVVQNGVTAINKSTEESVIATSQASKGVQEIASTAEQSSSAAQQASTNATQQSRGMQELAKAVEEISAMADELQN